MKKFLKVILIGTLSILLLCVSIIAVKCITTRGKLFSGYYLAYEINNDRETCTITEMVFTTVKEINIPETIDGYKVTRIGRAFSNPSAGCVILTSVTIPDSVEWIAEKAFYNCNKLVQVENGISYVDKWMVGGDSKMLSFTLRENTVGIAKGAFPDIKFQSVVMPSSVIYVNDSPSYNALIYYGGTVSDVSNMNFPNSSSGDNFSKWYYFSETLPTSTDYAYWHYVDGVPTVWNVIEYSSNADGTCNVSRARVGGTFDIPNVSPDGKIVTGICNSAFFQCWTLTNVTIPDSVTSIDSGAFYDCTALTNITIPESVTCIDGAFDNCHSLISITIPDGVTSIGEETFHECSSLTSITIPDGVTYIGDRTFANCSSLTSITFEGTITQWHSITFGSNWNHHVPATEVICSDGVVKLN